MSGLRRWIGLGVYIFLLTACSIQYPETCPSNTPVGLDQADEIANDESLPFRFPLEESIIDETLFFGWFGVSNECPPDKVDCYVYPERKFHAAEDYDRPAGTAVYAMADGIIRFSGRAKGYGWLIIIDHPQANLYSLYGHLSPSRWHQKNGTYVERGELIAYLGDSDENGGSKAQPVVTHLHFGIRAGQMADYPAKGEWRYQAGWIRVCPQDLGWLQPSLVITGREIPDGGYPQPTVNFFTRWGIEIIIAVLFTIFGINLFIGFLKKGSYYLLFIPGLIISTAGILFKFNALVNSYIVLIVGVLLLAAAVYNYVQRPTSTEE